MTRRANDIETGVNLFRKVWGDVWIKKNGKGGLVDALEVRGRSNQNGGAKHEKGFSTDHTRLYKGSSARGAKTTVRAKGLK